MCFFVCLMGGGGGCFASNDELTYCLFPSVCLPDWEKGCWKCVYCKLNVLDELTYCLEFIS